MRYEYFIGFRYLRAKRRQTFVSVITAIAVAGVMVGVAALIIVLSGMVGVQEYMRDKILGFNAHLTVSSPMGAIADPEAVMAKIRKVPGVTGASPFIEGQVMLQGRTKSQGVLARGIDPKTVGQVMDLNNAFVYGSLDDLKPREGDSSGTNYELPGVAIGEDLQHEMGVFFGEELPVIVAAGGLSPLGMRPKIKRFRIACIFKFGFYEVDSTVALFNLEDARALMNNSELVDGIEVKTDNIYKVDQTLHEVKAALGAGEFFCYPWYESQRSLFAALKMEELLSELVLSLILLVAAMNIISMLLMLVMEKYRDIAILKSMGATDAGITRIFITQGTVIGVVGTALGMLLGLVACWAQMKYHILAFDPTVYQFSVVPMKVTLGNLLGVSLGSILLSFLTTLYPSWQAARMKPAESLRYE